MRVVYFLLLFNLFFNIAQAQQIAVNKDSLKFFGYDDTLFVYNSGTSRLTIDSLFSSHLYFGYRLSIFTKDSSFNHYISFDSGSLGLGMETNDTIKFIFDQAVDLCTICKKSFISGSFTDTLNFISNSVVNETLLISVEGYGTVSVDNNYKVFPLIFKLNQNYPNPFNPSTEISYTLKDNSFVILKVFSSLGHEVAILKNEYEPAGNYTVHFDASKLSSGIYFYSITAGSFRQTKKMILLR